MSAPYANSGNPTAQIALSGTAKKVGTGASGVPLANRLMWRGQYIDDAETTTVMIGNSALTLANGFPLAAGVDALRAYGPGIDIYAITDTPGTVLFVEESA